MNAGSEVWVMELGISKRRLGMGLKRAGLKARMKSVRETGMRRKLMREKSERS